MSLSDPIANMLTVIRNGQSTRLVSVKCPSSNLCKGILDVLQRDGYIVNYSERKVRSGVNILNIDLKYYQGEPVIRKIDRVSKPGRRVYSSIADLPKVSNGLGVSILSTSKGVMPDHEARISKIGGEVLFNIF